ncbi:hypothetical protein DB32_002907 [Sandaracinus amylolyticus]|uniref:Uncharacterized protein n=2 Tax=Sandaracinus amylolyticus TaxID=927083 RepID=A0A0F6W2Q2_9BACT|nr:hypothetical protein DB32_002907 [Sandaracinus amylolyticus]
MVLTHENAARSVAEAITTYADRIQAALEPRMRPLLQRGEAMPDIALALKLLGRLVVADAAVLTEKDDANEAELADDVPLRAARDEAVAELYPTLVDLRDTLLPVYGAAGLAALKLSEPATKDPKPLARLASAVADALRSGVKLKVRREGVKIDRELFADRIEPLARALAEAVAGLEREGKENQEALLEKNAAFERAEESIAAASSITIALLELARLGTLADHVLPMLRRRGTASNPDAPES